LERNFFSEASEHTGQLFIVLSMPPRSDGAIIVADPLPETRMLDES
jgi:hypothetical protein